MRSAGDDLITMSVSDPPAAQALAEELRKAGGWLEVVAGIDSVVVRFDIASLDRVDIEQRLARIAANLVERAESSGPVVEVPVVYGGEYGPDFVDVCAQLGLSTSRFIELHCGTYTVDMLGFIPGFAYIGGLDERLSISRLPQPRQFVAAGSIGIAAGRTGLYSLPGPGGWPLIGRTSLRLFDAQADNPFALCAGATVIFSAIDAL